MKTTIDLADELVANLRKRTARDGMSLRAAVHEALRLWLQSQPPAPRPEPIPRDVGLMSGQGLTPEAAAFSWDDLRALSHDARG